MKSCELCKCTARIYCDSDQASLCWTCDAKVHSANFLVARHLRNLLCHSCQSPTPWSASGEKLGRTVSMCDRCVKGCDRLKDVDGDKEEREESQGCNDDDLESGSNLDSEEYEEEEEEDDDLLNEDEEDEEEEGGDNQVVPWSSTSPPQAASSSDSEEFSSVDVDVSSKRLRENVTDLPSEDEIVCSSKRNSRVITSEVAAHGCNGGGEDAFVDSSSSRPFKIRKVEPNLAERSSNQEPRRHYRDSISHT